MLPWLRRPLASVSVATALVFLSGCPEVPARAPQAAATGAPTGAPTGSPTSTSTAAGNGTSAPAEVPSATASAEPAAPNHTVGERITIVRPAMGTRVTLAAYTTKALGPAEVRKALEAAHAEIKRIERVMTTWRDDSEVSRVNAAAGKGAVKVSDETFAVVAKSQWISKLSDGVFDITFASMGKLWRFDQDWVAKVPTAAAVAKARERIDYRRIAMDPKAHTIALARSDTRINLGGIAKGYAIDRASAVLRKAGLPAFFAQAGGDLYVEGKKPDGKPWTVGVRDPRGADGAFFALLPVTDHAFSTAGDYERAFIKNGKRYHHIIDPRTGYPATASRSVTVWAKDALTADAIDDAVFILGPKRGLQLVESIDDCGAVIVDANNKVWVSKRLEGVVRVLRPPTGGI
jgi:thiamine biosynthesis lipoprotein